MPDLAREISRRTNRRLYVALASVIAITFVLEALVGLAIGQLPGHPGLWQALLEATVLTVLAVPLLYVFVVVPLNTYAVEREMAAGLLLDSERLLQESQSIAGLGSYVFDIASGRWRSSPVLDDIFGIDAAFDRSYEGWASLIHPDWRAVTERHFAEDVIARRGRFDFEYRIVRPSDGQARWVHGLGELEFDASGRPIRQLGTIQDVTERRQKEHELRLFRTLIDQSSDSIQVVDPTTMRFVDVNDRACQDLGYSREEMLQLSVGDIDPDFRRTGRPFDDQIRKTGAAMFETEHRRKDGSTFPVEINLAQVLLDRPYVIVVARNISARRDTEVSLRLQSAALNAAANMIVITDRDGRIEWVNHAFTRFTGYTAAEAIGRNPRELVRSGVHERAFYRPMWETLLAGDVWSGEMVNRRKDGSLYSEEQTITPIAGADGQVTHFIAVKQDVTERKKLEAQFLRAQRLESIGLLAGGIAHDLNNVLSPIMLSIDLLKSEASDAESVALLDTIGTSAQRGADLVKQVLSFARGIAGSHLDVQVRHLIRDMEKIANESFPKNIKVRSEIPRDLWTVQGDPTQLHQVLLNLCINARDAMPQGGQLTITAANATFDDRFAAANPDVTAGPYVVIDVEDTGTGIPPEVIDKIFDPFFTTKEAGHGTGLGLSTTMTIIKRHDGFLRVTSTPGAGTRFRIYLPAQLTSHGREASVAAGVLPRGSGQTVLVVDDEAAIREMTRRLLESSGYHVRVACDGVEAVSLYSQQAGQIDAVMMDMMMPTMDGASAIQRLLKMNSKLPILAVSGRGAGSDPPTAADGRAIPFLLKPFSPDELLRAVHKIVPGGPAS